jgi:hypothetical protein
LHKPHKHTNSAPVHLALSARGHDAGGKDARESGHEVASSHCASVEICFLPS